MTGAPPKVFISYSHDTVQHQERVLGIADRLRTDGVDAEIDQYNDAPPEGWPRWCERQIEVADSVLMVCTETYRRRVNGDEQQGKGLGVLWEAQIIRHCLYDTGGVSDKFIPVLFSDASPEQIPMLIKGRTRYIIDMEDGYDKLYRRLTGQQRLLRPKLGKIRPRPTRSRHWSEDARAALSSPALTPSASCNSTPPGGIQRPSTSETIESLIDRIEQVALSLNSRSKDDVALMLARLADLRQNQMRFGHSSERQSQIWQILYDINSIFVANALPAVL